MMIAVILLAIGFVLLVKGADFFVSGSSDIAKTFHIPSLIIGLTIVAMGTSAPEAAVSVTAALGGQNDIAIANIVGSNIFNVLVVVGISAWIAPLKAQTSMIKKEIPFSILAGVILFVMSFDHIFSTGSNSISRGDGLVLLMIFAMFMYSLIIFAVDNKTSIGEDDTPPMPVGKCLLFVVGGLAGIIFGGQMVVNGATTIATALGVSQNLIGLTIVAVGTSLPELVTSIVAARKGESDIALGNAIGSNVFNVLFILGASALISPMAVNPLAFYDMILLFFFSLVVYFFAFTGKRINRKEGIAMTAIYVAYLVYIIWRA